MMLRMQEYAYTERHMGTDVTISLVVPDESLAKNIAKETFETVAEYERRFSRFLPDSELSTLNVRGTHVVSDMFLEVLKKSLELSRITNGAFNPLTQVSRLGYTQDFAMLKESIANIDSNTYSTDLANIHIDEQTKRVALAEGQQLDFGGFLKGYLAEKLAKDIEARYPECTGIIVNLGGDLHTRGLDENDDPFTFLIYDPIADADIPVVVTNKSLATSGSYKRTWHTEAGTKHHIVDSTTHDNPSSNIISASIVHDDGAVAEAYAKLFIVRGVEEALRVASAKQYTYICITSNGEHITN